MTWNMAHTSRTHESTAAHAPWHRICMVVDTAAKTDARVMRAATAMAKADFSVTVVDVECRPDASRREVSDGIAFNHVTMPGWCVRTRFKPWFLVKYALMLARWVVRLLAISTDVYHAHDQVVLPACWFAAKVRRKPLIFDAHELPLEDPHLMRWRTLHRMASVLLRSMLQHCTRVITVSEPIAQELARRYGGGPPVVVRNIPTYQRAATSERLRQRLQLARDTRIALYQGGLQPNRALGILVRAAKHLDPGVVIVMMGSGRSQPAIEALIDQEGVSDRVKLLPVVPYAELLSWTASADVGLNVFSPEYSLSIKYCLPNKLFEYLMAGLPVLTSKLDAVADLIERYDVGVVIPSLEPEAVGHAINRLLADNEARARMRQNALAACERELRWDVEQNRLLDLYYDLLGRDAKPLRENS